MCSEMVFFFFKQKTAYDRRISDWSSDVCSSDLGSGSLTSVTGPVTNPSSTPRNPSCARCARALAHSATATQSRTGDRPQRARVTTKAAVTSGTDDGCRAPSAAAATITTIQRSALRPSRAVSRQEEGQVGKEGGREVNSRGSPYQLKKKKNKDTSI